MSTLLGHNGGPSSVFDRANAANRQTALYLLGREFLVTAIQDRRLERSHLRVLACIVIATNTELKAWPSRSFIAERTGLSVKTVSNILLELKRWEYLISDKETVPEANDRRLTVYTFGNIDHETIRREITIFVEGLRAVRTSPPAGNFPAEGEQNFPAHGELPRRRGTVSSPPTGNITAHGEQKQSELAQSSPPTGTRNKTPILNLDSENPIDVVAPKKSKPAADRGTRLPKDWVLTKSLGDWAIENFAVSPEQVRLAASQFKDYWDGKPGAAGRKLDWAATWRNWCRNQHGWRIKPGSGSDHAPSLAAVTETSLAVYQAQWDEARAMAGDPYGDD